MPHGGAAADRLRPAARRALGHLRVGVQLVDRHGNYQYKAFGVPGLGLKRGLGDDLVVAPYATALAAMVDPARAAENFRRLAREGAEGAVRLLRGHRLHPSQGAESDERRQVRERSAARGAVVRAFLAHHQGMSLVALANALLGDLMVRRFHADPRVQATALLLQERVPRHAPITQPRPAEETRVRARGARRGRCAASARRTRVIPHAQFLSNGAYVTVVTNAGGGASLCRGRRSPGSARTRRAIPEASSSTCATCGAGSVWSATYQPTGARAGGLPRHASSRSARSSGGRDDGIETQLEIAVSPEDDVEVRRLSLTNQSDRPREIEVTSYAEIALAPPAEDLAHPAFGKLFIETEYLPESAALLCAPPARGHRRTPGMWAVHVLSVEGRMQGPVEWETDRLRFLGRGTDRRGSGRARRPCALGHHRRGARSDREPAAAHPPRAGRLRAPLVRDRHRQPAARRRWPWRRSTTTRVRPPAPSRSPSPRRRARCATWASRATRRSSTSASPRACSTPTARCAPRRRVLARQHARPVGPLGPRHLGRPADPARARGRGGRHPAGAPGAAGAGVLAPQGPERRRRDPQRASGELPGRDARAAHGTARHRPVGRLEAPAGRRLPAARATG